MALTVNRLHPLFAAELLGADLQEPPSPELIETVEGAMADYGVLVVRDQRVSDEDHIRFSRAFGPLELPPDMGYADRRRRLRRELYDASNLDVDGDILAEGSAKRDYNKGAERFHTDSSFNILPTKWSLLLRHEVPPSGGDTEFLDARVVYEELPDATRIVIEKLTAEHDIYRARERGGLKGVTDEMRKAMPPAFHPLVRTMPNGRKALYLGAHAVGIVGWPQEKALALIDELYAFATQRRFVYAHKWRQGDLVIWDNRCTMHRATPFESFKHRRDVRRTTINEYGPEMSSTTANALAAAKRTREPAA